MLGMIVSMRLHSEMYPVCVELRSKNPMTQNRNQSAMMQTNSLGQLIPTALAALVIALAVSLAACSGERSHAQAGGPTITVGVAKVTKKSLGRQITLSSELVPFQEIDVYAKESGYVKKLMVDYGTRVKAGEVMADSGDSGAGGATAGGSGGNQERDQSGDAARSTNWSAIRRSTTLCICNTRA